MPSSSTRFLLRGLSVTQFEKLIPRKWKLSVNQLDAQENHLILEKHAPSDKHMIYTLFRSLKEFAGDAQLKKAFQTFSRIQLHVISSIHQNLVLHSVSSLLSSCTNAKSLSLGKQLHAWIISSGYDQHPLFIPKLVTFYSKLNQLEDARVITVNSNILHPLPWNLLISSYIENGRHGDALSMYRQMLSKGVRPDNFTYPSVLKACGENLDLVFGREIHESIIASRHEWNLFVHNSLISMYAKTGELGVGRRLFDQMPERDDVSLNTIISGYASKGMWNDAFELFEKMMAEGVYANIITWNTIAGGCLRIGNFRGALLLLSKMRSCGVLLDSVAMIIGLTACSHLGAIELGTIIHGLAVHNCFDRLHNVSNALINMYARCKDLRRAYLLFQTMDAKSVITWNSMLCGFANLDQSEEAAFLFREMLFSGVEPNYVTIASILPLCARVANLQHGKEFHCYIIRRSEFKEYLLLWNSLIDMYARSGKVLQAKRVFDSVSSRDEITYTSLIAAYGIQGQGQLALKLFDEMIKCQIKPDHVTMVAVLSACSHSGLVNEGKMYFEKMYSIYGVVPHLEHYACMVDLYGRAGLLFKAKEIMTRMPYRPTSAMWATLLGACRIHGNTDIGEWAAEKLLDTEPENSGYYVLIANMYAATGSWNKLAKVRTYMRDLGVRKDPGCAWVDAGSGLLPFLVGDTSQPHSDDLYSVLGDLTEQMKYAGHVAREKIGFEDELLVEVG